MDSRHVISGENDDGQITTPQLTDPIDHLSCHSVFPFAGGEAIHFAQILCSSSTFKLMRAKLPFLNDPRYARLETNLGSGRPRKGSNSARLSCDILAM
ncbi:hypothetical protein TNCV_1189921 [Trichonephila clavipes]|nr:hypothetical protein TNCV_1189921 [Trichonephila clavipes]